MDEKNIMQEKQEDGITLVDLFNALKSNIILLLVICIGVVAIGFIYTWFWVTPMYTSSIDIHISNDQNENVSTLSQIRSNVKEIVRWDEIIEVAIYETDTNYTNIDSTIKSIKGRISTSEIGAASAVRVSYQDTDPIKAARMVIAIAEEAAVRINIPKGQEFGNKASLAFASENITLVNKPRENPNQSPSSPNKMLNLAISLILGLIVGVVLVILKEQFSNYFKTRQEVENYTNIKVIAMIPEREGVKQDE